IEDVLGQEVFTHGVEEFKTREATFVCTETAFMVPVDVGEVEVTGHEKTFGRGQAAQASLCSVPLRVLASRSAFNLAASSVNSTTIISNTFLDVLSPLLLLLMRLCRLTVLLLSIFRALSTGSTFSISSSSFAPMPINNDYNKRNKKKT
ncbi:hypothetical protein BpHYR1_000611, partial [Brachionus plicatilis]